MRIIPVIDLKDCTVVRGVAGRRDLYRPVESVLGCDATPKGVASAFVGQFGFQSVYVADLAAIAGAPPNWEAYDAIASSGLRLLVDAGTNRVDQAPWFADKPVNGWCIGVVFGLESLRNERDLPALLDAVGVERALFSLDLRNGKALTDISDWRKSHPDEIVDAVVDAGFKRLIVLDLAYVGVGEGVAVQQLCSSTRARYPHVEITSGGGVRDKSDLYQLAEAGCDVALVASAIHNGSLTLEDINEFA
ncbi:MAG: hisA/hisF family protein [Planctomycetes bacterium]|nr:hisA/hisF family protein [Planctomycetota bacterium]